MKIFKKIIIAICSILMIATSCAKVDNAYKNSSLPTNSKGEYAIVFSNGTPNTKSVTNPAITHDYTSFDVYAWKDGAATAMFPYTVVNNGNEWLYDTTSGQELQYFDRNSNDYEFIGLISNGVAHPANGSVGLNVTGVKAFENENDETDTPDELLWAYASVAKASYDSEVPLAFKHANAKMYLGFASDRFDTEILNYVPERESASTVVPNTQNSKLDGTAWARISTAVGAVITQEDIDYINSLFTYNSGLVFTYGDSAEIPNTEGYISGYFEEAAGIKDYLITKYPELASVSDIFMNSFTNFYLIHVEKNGNEVCGWFYNKKKGTTSSVTTYTETTIPGTIIPGIEGIRVFSVSKDAQDKNIRAPHTTEASAVIANTCVLTQTANSGDGADSNITFTKPSGAVVKIDDFNSIDKNTSLTWSPTVWFALPVENPDNGYVVKFSYTYNGITYYDARVHIPAGDSNFEQGKYYRYVIYIGDKTNGITDPDDANDKKDDVDTDNLPIRFNVQVQTYVEGEFKTYKLGAE